MQSFDFKSFVVRAKRNEPTIVASTLLDSIVYVAGSSRAEASSYTINPEQQFGGGDYS